MKKHTFLPINEASEIIKDFLKEFTTHKLETIKVSKALKADFICEIETQIGSIKKIYFWFTETTLSFGADEEKTITLNINEIKKHH